jgi:hypothetical protein
VKVVVELPATFRDFDLNLDGQLGMYEWPRRDWARFATIDINGDGFATPAELIASGITPPGATAVATAAPRSTPAPAPATGGTSPPPAQTSSPAPIARIDVRN